MSWSHKQNANNSGGAGGASSQSVAFGSSVAAGDIIALGFLVQGTEWASITSVGDQLGNTYTKLGGLEVGAHPLGVYLYAAVVTTAGTPTVTVQLAGTSYIEISADDFAWSGGGTPSQDGSTVTGSGSGTAVSASSALSPSGTDLVIAVAASWAATVMTVGSGWTESYSGPSSDAFLTEYGLNQSSSITPTATAGSDVWSILGAAFKPGGATFQPWIFGDQVQDFFG